MWQAARSVSFHVFLGFHVDFFALGGVELILEEGESLVGDDAYAEAVLHLPAALQRDKALVDVGGYVGVDV